MAVVLGGRGDWLDGELGEQGLGEQGEAALQDRDHDRVLRRYISEDDDRDGAEVLPWWCPATVPDEPEQLNHPEPEPEPVVTMQTATASSDQVASLHCAVFRQDQAAVDRLLAAGADPDEPDYSGSGDTPLMQAVSNGHVGIVRSLCAAGCSVDARRVNGQSSLMLCVLSRASRRSPRLLLQVLEVLLAAGAEPGVREKLRGQTALHALAKLVAADPAEPHLLTALRLLCQRAQPHGVNAQDHRRRSALHHLASRGCAHPEPYQILLEARADPALQNARGDTPLVEFLENVADKAELGGDVVRLLCNQDVARRNTQYGESLLHVAARRNRLAAVRAALASGADPAHQDLRGNTPLHLAASRGYTEVVAVLLTAPGCQVNATNRDGLTPLHVAVESGFVDVVNTLLGAEGVDVGPSVLELAQQEYRFRAQPHLARTLASELDRRMSLSLSLSPGTTRPPSTCSYATTASISTLGAASSTPRRTPSRRTLADEEYFDAHPINYLGAQVSCLSRVRPRYSATSDQLADGCIMPMPAAQLQVQQVQHKVVRREKAGKPGPEPEQVLAGTSAGEVHDAQPAQEAKPDRARSVAVDLSLREAAELMQKLCDEDLSVSPPADWSPPISRLRASRWSGLQSETTTFTERASLESTPKDDGPRDHEGLRDLGPRSEVASSTPSAGSYARRTSSTESRRSSRRTSSEKVHGGGKKFNLPANPYATMRNVEDADEDTSDLLVESLLAVAKSITDPEAGLVDDFDRTVEIPKDYELFERSVLFGGAGGGASENQSLRGMARSRVADTAIASR